MVDIVTALAQDHITPAEVLGALVSLDPDLDRWSPLAADLLTHPNLPPGVATATWEVTNHFDLHYALTRPGVRAGAQRAAVRATTAEALSAYLRQNPAAPAPAVREEAARSRTARGPLASLSSTATAENLFRTQHISPADHLVAVRTLAASALPQSAHRLVAFEATRHPAHLGDLADLAGGELRDLLRRYGAVHARGGDVRDAVLGDALAAIRAQPSATAWARAITDTADAKVAAAALTAYPVPAVITAIVKCPRLRGTAVGRAAQLLDIADRGAYLIPPLVSPFDQPTQRHLRALIGQATSWQQLWWVHPQAGWDPATFRCLWDALDAVADSDDSDGAGLRRLRTWVATAPGAPLQFLEDVTQRLRTDDWAPERAAMAPWVAHADDRQATTPAAAGGRLPVPLVRATATRGPFGQDVTYSVVEHLRGWHGHLARPAFLDAAAALEPEFAGTVAQLLQSAAAITANPG